MAKVISIANPTLNPPGTVTSTDTYEGGKRKPHNGGGGTAGDRSNP